MGPALRDVSSLHQIMLEGPGSTSRGTDARHYLPCSRCGRRPGTRRRKALEAGALATPAAPGVSRKSAAAGDSSEDDLEAGSHAGLLTYGGKTSNS